MQRFGALLLPFALLAGGCAAEAGDDAASSEQAQTAATLPACASPLMKTIFEATQSTIKRGSVPASLYATSRSSADLTPLLTGPEIFPAMRSLIASAEREVLLQTFVFNSDNDPAKEIFAGLADLAARRAGAGGEPVLVRLLVDVTQVSGTARRAIPELARQVDALHLPPEAVKVEIAAYRHFAVGTMHAKTLVVDGRSAIVTGANMQKQHDYSAPWFDTAYRFDGEVGAALQADHDEMWGRSELWTCGAIPEADRDGCSAPVEKPVRKTPFVAASDPALAGACVPMIVTTRAPNSNPFNNRTDNTQDQGFIAAFRGARHVIRLQTPNLNDDAAKKAIVAAMKANPELEVQMVISKGFNEKTERAPGQGGGNEKNVNALYSELDKQGVERGCERLRVRWYSHDGVTPLVGNGPYASHAKYTSFDDQVVIVGSANMDTQSWNNSKETNVVVDSAEITRAWDGAMFGPNFARGIDARSCGEPLPLVAEDAPVDETPAEGPEGT